MNEEWRPVVGYETRYEVSNQGSVRRSKDKFILKPIHKKHYRYLVIHLSRTGKYCSFRIHRLVAAAFLGPCPRGHVVNHKDGNPKNNYISNLEYLTWSGNQLHSYVMGLRIPPRGETHGSHKLTETDVEIIRQMCQAGERMKDIAGRFDVAPCTISHVIHRRYWGWVL